MTPSPSFREKQRTIKAHSMPAVPSLGQVLASQNGQISAMYPQPQQQQPSPTASNSSHQSRRSPPPTSRISPTTSSKLASGPAERSGSPAPPLHHAHSTPVVPQLISQSLPNPHHPRPVPRAPPPPFLNQYPNSDDRWAVTEELMAEFEREHYASHPAGIAGVAYAGGAASSNLKRHDSLNVNVNAPAKDPAVERVKATDRASPKDSDGGGGAKRQMPVQVKEQSGPAGARESPKGHTRERSGTVSSAQAQQLQGEVRTPEYRGSPQYQTPMASPNERTAGYTQYVPENYQQGAQQNVPRKPVPGAVGSDASSNRLTPPASSKLATNTHTPPLQVMGSRPPDRSLPLQEPEEDNGHEDFDQDEPEYSDRHHGSPTPSSDLYPEGHTNRYDNRHDDDDDDDGTLNEEGEEERQQNKGSEDSEASGYTPRSPSTTLPERPPNVPYASQSNQYVENQKTIRAAKHRSGITDQLGMRSFDPTMFERDTVNNLRNGSAQDVPLAGTRERASQSPQQQPSPPQQDPHRQQIPYPPYDPRQYSMNLNRVLDQRLGYGWNQTSVQSDDMQSLIDDPTSSYLRTFLGSGSVRPGAPIPPTPQSHTAAPSPSPLISATPSDIEPRQIGSPYPYPFTHIRRSTVSGPTPALSSTYDPNNPNIIREQLALQMQIYALNNGLAPPSSESAFSPSSTPFPGPGYNPWAFVPAGGGLGLNDQSMAASIRSSPSHEPVNLPPPPAMRGRGLRRREQNGHLHAQPTARPARRAKPPPRVDSTQPRETSPEPSSGEETAGEERFVDQYVGELDGSVSGKGRDWNGTEIEVSPAADDDGEWVDEEEDGEGDDLLDLEFHPTYVSNPQKRRRRFDTRWDALVQAFQALDRETDATLVVLAAPSHTTKLHSLASRSLRRDPALINSTALASVRRSFSHLAAERRAARKAQRMSLAERLSNRSDSSADGSPGSGTPGEVDLRRALDTALGSLGALSTIYEQREARWRDEMRRLNEDRERVELLLAQALGPVLLNGHMDSALHELLAAKDSEIALLKQKLAIYEPLQASLDSAGALGALSFSNNEMAYSGPPSRRSGGRPIQDGGASQGSPGKLIDTDDPDKEAAQLVGPDPAQAGSPSPTQKKLDLQDDIELSDPASDREIVGSSNLSGRGKRRRKVTWKIREGFDTKTRSNILSDNVGQRKQRKLNAATHLQRDRMDAKKESDGSTRFAHWDEQDVKPSVPMERPKKSKVKESIKEEVLPERLVSDDQIPVKDDPQSLSGMGLKDSCNVNVGQLVNPEAKVKKEFLLKEEDLLQLVAPSALCPHPISLPRNQRFVTITREQLKQRFGGNTMETFPRPSAQRIAAHGYNNFMCINLLWNPHGTQIPGHGGLFFETTVWPGDPWTANPKHSAVQVLFTRVSQGKWLYLGEYELSDARPLTVEQWNGMHEGNRVIWPKEIAERNWGIPVRARIHLRRTLGREPTRDEVENAQGRFKNIMMDQVRAALDSGEESIQAWSMKCVGYDEDFQREVIRLAGRG
ncbi:hypothetical protein BD311DRAFT_661819 [Dichomitus squalens]|uniref:DUF6697 domain-containing protein n=1 Tax=Dichomitus squalens TaxID=114155 RepID=A0A4Q9MNA7_9APHY|nr:hypothetical protein BD311DRAFT_661819 [Dichomitus squalens]